jgi:ABC-type branched-subunit amino acid transport system substrate-binding protein
MKKIIILIILAAFIITGITLYHPQEASPNKPIINIGITLPMTGNMAHIGISSQNAIDMAYSKWADKNTKYEYHLSYQDDGFDAKNVASNTNRFITIDKAKAVLSIFSIGANVVSPITNNAQIIHFTCAYGSQPAEGFYNFNNQTQYEENAQTLINELKANNIKSISLFTQNNIGSLQQTEVLSKMLERSNIQVLNEETYNPGVRDFTMIISKALQKGKPDIFYIDGLNPDAVIFIKNLKEITGKNNLTTINDFIEPHDKSVFNGLWFVESAYGTPAFVKEFESKNNDTPYTCAANSFDNLDMLIWAYENTTPRNKDVVPHNDDVVKTLLSIKNWDSAVGNVSIDEKGIVQSKASVKTIKEGKVEPK